MASGGHALSGVFGRQAGADGETAAQPLGRRHDVGLDPGPFVGEQLARAPTPVCTSSRISRIPRSRVSSRSCRRKAQPGKRTPPSPWTGS